MFDKQCHLSNTQIKTDQFCGPRRAPWYWACGVLLFNWLVYVLI
jgi:hypothetical protein